MAKLPRYESSILTQPVAAPTVTSGAKAASDFDRLSSRVSRQVQDVLDFDAVQQGKSAGSNINFKEQEPITQSQRIFERRALQANQVAIFNNVKSHARQLFNDEIKPGNFSTNSPENFRKKMKAYTNGMLQSIPKSNRQYAANVADRTESQYHTWLNNRANKLGQQEGRESLYEYLNTLQQQSQNDLVSGNIGDILSATGAYGMGVRKINEATKSGLLTGKQAFQLKSSWKSQLQVAAVVGKYREDLKNGKGDTSLESFIMNPPKDMSFKDQQIALNHMRSLKNAYQQAENINDNILDSQIYNSLNQVSQGNLDPNSPEASQIFSNIAQSKGNEEALKYNDNLTSAQKTASVKNSIRFMSPQKFNDSISQIAKNLDPNTRAGERGIKDLNEISALYLKERRSFKNDPAAFVSDSPFVMQAASAAALQPNKNGMGLLQDKYYSTTNLNQAMIQQELELGATMQPKNGQPLVSLIPNDKAKEIVGYIQNLPFEGQIGALQEIEKKYGPKYSKIALRDLTRAGYPAANLITLDIAKNTPAMGPNVVAAQDANKKELSSFIDTATKTSIDQAVTNGLTSLIDSFGSSMSFPVSQISSMKNKIINLSYYLLASNKASSAHEATKMALDAYINNNYSFSSYGGSIIRVPKDETGKSVDIGTLKEMMRLKQKQALRNPELPLVKSAFGKNSAVEQNAIQSIRDFGKWVTTPDDSGVFMVDALGSPVVVMNKKTGKPENVMVKFSSVDSDIDPLAKKASRDIQRNKYKNLDILAAAFL